MDLKLIFYLFLTAAFISACGVAKKSNPVWPEKTVDTQTNTQFVSETESIIDIQPEQKGSAELPETTESAELPLTEGVMLKPALAAEVHAAPILISRPIPGKPVITIYRVREGDIPEEPQKEIPEPDIAQAVKPEPTTAVTPEPTVIPELEIVEPASSDESVVQKVDVKPEKGIVPQPAEVTSESVITQSIVETVTTDDETKQTPENRAAGLPPEIEIISPKNGSFYSGKIRIEGKLANSNRDMDSVDTVTKATWEIPGLREPEEIVFGSDGVFFLSIPVENYNGTLTIDIKAAGKSGKSGIKRLTLYDGNIAPEMTVISPEEESSFGAFLNISGTVTDPSAEALGLEGPERLEYSLFPVEASDSGKEITGTIPVSPGGGFSEVIKTQGISGNQFLTLKVYGRNGKTVTFSRTILKGESDIPGFSVIPGDGSTVISWNALPGADSYTLYYSNNEEIPGNNDELSFKNVKSPLSLKNLSEGARYAFRLKAVVPDRALEAEEYWSSVKEFVALTPLTLKPLATNEYQQIRLVWLAIPGANSFNIYRSEDAASTFRLLVSDFEGSSYIDKTAVFGKKYYYKISPALENSLMSESVAAETLKFPEEKTVVIERKLEPQLQHIAAQGSYLFLASGSDGIKIIDSTDGDNPVEIGKIGTQDARDIIIQGERAYVADGKRGLKVVDIGNPREPEVIGSRKTTGAVSLALQGTTVYIADGTSGIKIMDITSERTPSRLGTVPTRDARDIILQDGFLYLADGIGGVKIFSVESPAVLKPQGEFREVNAASIAVNGNLMAVTEPGMGIRLIDISNKSTPYEMRTILSSNVTEAAIKDNYLFFTSRTDGLSIYEVSDPSRPVLFDSIKDEGASGLTLAEGTVLVIDDNGYRRIKSFTTGRSFTIAEFQTGGKAYNVTLKNNMLFLADHRNGVKIIDAARPTESSHFSVTDSIETSFAESVFFRDNKMFIADGKGGIKMADVTFSADGIIIGNLVTVDLPGVSKSVTVHGDYAYIAVREKGISILNMGTGTVKSSYTGGRVYETYVSDTMLYAADASAGVKIYSLEDPEDPQFISQVDIPHVTSVNYTNGVVIAGGENGLTFIAVQNPENPVIISRYPFGWVEDITIHGNYLYAAAGSEGLSILDIKDPENPVLVSSCEDVYAVGVDVKDDLAFVADIDGFKVVKILIPSWLQ